MTLRVNDAAAYLCDKSGWRLSNLPLQKILYMADMNFVGINGHRMLDEDFEAWDYGPVIPSLYHKCKAFGAKPIPPVFWGAKDITGTREGDMLDLAWQNLHKATPGALVEKTHSAEGAWVKRYVPGARQRIISTDDMIEEYGRRRARSTQQVA